MGDLSPNFSRSEFACQGCEKMADCPGGFDTIDSELLVVLETIRDRFGPVIPTSGARCSTWNKEVGGSENSQHLVARACDFETPEADAAEVQDFIDNTWPDTYGLGRYDGWTHVDTRKQKARWSG